MLYNFFITINLPTIAQLHLPTEILTIEFLGLAFVKMYTQIIIFKTTLTLSVNKHFLFDLSLHRFSTTLLCTTKTKMKTVLYQLKGHRNKIPIFQHKCNTVFFILFERITTVAAIY